MNHRLRSWLPHVRLESRRCDVMTLRTIATVAFVGVASAAYAGPYGSVYGYEAGLSYGYVYDPVPAYAYMPPDVTYGYAPAYSTVRVVRPARRIVRSYAPAPIYAYAPDYYWGGPAISIGVGGPYWGW